MNKYVLVRERLGYNSGMATNQPTRKGSTAPEAAQSATVTATVTASERRQRIFETPDAWQCAGPANVKIAAGAIFKRLQYPKALCGAAATYKRTTAKHAAGEVTKATRDASLTAKMPRLLGADDYREVFQTCAAILAARDEMDAPAISYDAWIAMFRGCRKALRLDNHQSDKEESTDPVDMVDISATEVDAERRQELRQKLARRISYWRSAIAHARELDASRQRRHKWQRNRETLRAVASGAFRPANLTQAESEAASKALAKLRAAVEVAETAWTAEAELDAAARSVAAAQAAAIGLARAMAAF